jgi:acyl carrier protein
VIADYAELAVDVSTLTDADDLYESGMTSHASLEVMLALENEFDVEFPDRLFHRGVFQSVSSLKAAIGELTSSAVA